MVVAVIAVVVAIAMPALSFARRSAKITSCAASLRGFGVSFTLYRDQHRGVLPFANELYSLPVGWLEPLVALEPFLDVPLPRLDPAGRIVTGAPFLCPSDLEYGPIHGMSYAYIPAAFMQVMPPAGAAEYVTSMIERSPEIPLMQDYLPWHASRNTLRIDGAVRQRRDP